MSRRVVFSFPSQAMDTAAAEISSILEYLSGLLSGSDGLLCRNLSSRLWMELLEIIWMSDDELRSCRHDTPDLRIRCIPHKLVDFVYCRGFQQFPILKKPNENYRQSL